MVRGLPSARGHRSYGHHHGLWLLCRFGHRPTGSRDLLRRAASTEPQTFFAWDRPSPRDPTWPIRASRAKKTKGVGSISTEFASSTLPSATEPQAELAQALEEVGSLHPPDHRKRLRQALQPTFRRLS